MGLTRLKLTPILACAALAVSALPSCAPAPDASEATNEAATIAPVEPKIDQAVIDHAKSELRKEPQVVDFVLAPENAVMLQVAVKDDGSRQYGLAEYFCLKLKEWKLDTGHAVVRIVDASKVAASNGDFRSISLGTVQCWDQERWD